MKAPRDPSKWTNVDVQEDSAGFLAAQAAEREDKEAALEQQRYADDLERWTQAFVAQGGDPDQAEAAFKAQRNERAGATATRQDDEARFAMRRRMRASL